MVDPSVPIVKSVLEGIFEAKVIGVDRMPLPSSA
jgi:hypothetical protein